MAYRPATGRRAKVDKKPKTVRAIMRRHLRLEGKTMVDLAPVWDMRDTSVWRRFYDTKRAMSPQYIDSFIDFLKLDDFDAYELRLAGAIEAGWQLHKGQPL